MASWAHAWLALLCAVSGAACRGRADAAPAPAPTPSPTWVAPTPAPSPTWVAPAPPPTACPTPGTPAAPAVTDTLHLTAVRWADLPGWRDDTLGEVIPALRASCAKLDRLADGARVGVAPMSGTARDWRRVCKAAARVSPTAHGAARAVLERELRPYAAASDAGPAAKLTGYHVALLRGSRTRHDAYQVPLLARPKDLVSIDLTPFLDDARGRRVWGRLDPRTGSVVPYATRAEIRRGALDAEHLELVWVDSKVDALFAEVEGSARVTLDDGGELWLEFDGKNGRPYKGVGKLLRELGELAPGEGTVPGIRAWFAAHPSRVDEIIDQNPSKVFFKVTTRRGAMGSQGVLLTPRRSLAIDRAYIAHTTPVWVETDVPVVGGAGTLPWRHLLIAQDTGGGILGPLRGDVYWGDDAAAEEVAGRMGGPGRFWLLLPRSVVVPDLP